MFFPWARITLLKPTRVDIEGSLSRPLSATPLSSEIVDHLRLAEEETGDHASHVSLISVPLLLMFGVPHQQHPALEVGKRDLIAELGGPVLHDFNAVLPAGAWVSRDFVPGIFKFGPSCPPDIDNKAIDLVLAQLDQFS